MYTSSDPGIISASSFKPLSHLFGGIRLTGGHREQTQDFLVRILHAIDNSGIRDGDGSNPNPDHRPRLEPEPFSNWSRNYAHPGIQGIFFLKMSLCIHLIVTDITFFATAHSPFSL